MNQRTIAAIMVSGAFAFAAIACGSLGGIDGFVNVDCVNDCGVDGSNLDGTTAAEATDGAAEAASGCPAGSSSVTVTAGGNNAVSAGALGTIPASGTSSFCVPDGTTVTLSASGDGDGKGTWDGVVCNDGNRDTSRCEFTVNGAVSVSFSQAH